MVKNMRFDWTPSSISKYNYVVVKIGVSVLIMGIVFHLFFSTSSGVDIIEVEQEEEITPFVEEEARTPSSSSRSQSSASVEVHEFGGQIVEKGKCDIFIGDWVPDHSGPIYTNKSCHILDDNPQNCMTNGRPDTGYLYWRWNPRDCQLPRFDAVRFLDFMKNKSWAFVGDSISRNHVDSLVCILSKVEEAVLVYHDLDYKNRRWRFPTYNFTLSALWSPFLIRSDIFIDPDGDASSEIQVHLDKLDENWKNQYQSFDYMVVNTGKWYFKTAIYYENNTITGCHYCPGKNLTDIGLDLAYRKSLQLVLNYLTSSNHKATILFRTATPDHFENGEWFSGGTCKRTMPFKEGEITFSNMDSMFRNIELEEFQKALKEGLKNEVNIKVLDMSQMTLLRPDGHPGPYTHFQPFAKDKNAKVQNDCLHWCLPGPIDSWNDLIMEMVVNS
ncbi:hypothetical protein GIB67_042339 [Kingdonia uniflora]|uniref:Trichome birefringence-like N-terminal domain-containing protein n=1 Tax=Kingdonia uniflora TaxID=39325 RepID=A0A7J7LE47_9MAGN|nr:hypothetical protein GIB67_042339 [Kingdonia uniflora]